MSGVSELRPNQGDMWVLKLLKNTLHHPHKYANVQFFLKKKNVIANSMTCSYVKINRISQLNFFFFLKKKERNRH